LLQNSHNNLQAILSGITYQKTKQAVLLQTFGSFVQMRPH